MSEQVKNNRIVLLDFIRGVLIIWVLFDHFFYTAGFIFAKDATREIVSSLSKYGIRYWNSTYRAITHPLVLFLFFFISGAVSDFSKNKLKRAIILTVMSGVVWLVTYACSFVSGKKFTVIFGVLYVFAVCGFVALLLEKIKAKSLPVLIVGIVLSFIGILYLFGLCDFLGPQLFFIVNNEKGFEYSADYFSLLPYLGYMLIGYAFGQEFYKEKKPLFPIPPLAQKIMSPITFIGRTSLWWYLLSQVAFIIIFFLLIVLGV